MPYKRYRIKIGTGGNGVEENKDLVRRIENDRSHNAIIFDCPTWEYLLG